MKFHAGDVRFNEHYDGRSVGINGDAVRGGAVEMLLDDKDDEECS